jgi:hypothetical protein
MFLALSLSRSGLLLRAALVKNTTHTRGAGRKKKHARRSQTRFTLGFGENYHSINSQHRFL